MDITHDIFYPGNLVVSDYGLVVEVICKTFNSVRIQIFNRKI